MSLSSHGTRHITDLDGQNLDLARPGEDPKPWGPFANGSEDDGQDHASEVDPEL